MNNLASALLTCGCTLPMMQAIVNKQINSLSDLALLSRKDLRDMTKRITSRDAARGGINIPNMVTKRLEALVTWLHLQNAYGADLDTLPPNVFTNVILSDTIRRMNMKDELHENTSTVATPAKFDPLKMVTFEQELDNYLASIDGTRGINISYVVRKPRTDNTFTSIEQYQKYTVRQEGIEYDQDNALAWRHIKPLLINTPGWPWVQAFDESQNATAAMAALRTHYYGPGHIEARIAAANKRIKDAHYRSEATFSFDKYVTVLKEQYEILRECGIITSERTKVSTMIEQMHVTNNDIRPQMTLIRTDPTLNANFDNAANKLKEVISVVHPPTGKRNYRGLMSMTARGRGGRGNRGGRGGGRGRGRGRGRNSGRGGRNAEHANDPVPSDIDVSNPFRTFSPDEFRRLPSWFKHMRRMAMQQQRSLPGMANGDHNTNSNRSAAQVTTTTSPATTATPIYIAQQPQQISQLTHSPPAQINQDGNDSVANTTITTTTPPQNGTAFGSNTCTNRDHRNRRPGSG